MYSSSDAIVLDKDKDEPNPEGCFERTHREERGTTIDVKRSYFEFHSFTEFLKTIG
jgi:hypothetical protein